MTVRLVTALAVAALLSGCAASPLAQVALNKMGGGASSAAAQPAKGAAEKWVTLLNRGVKFKAAQLSERDGVSIWAAKDGSQVFLRGPMLVGTRGFGRDLMSADAPTLAVLAAGHAHQRSYYDMDGTDTMIRHVYDCTAGSGDAKDALPGTTLLVEDCVSDLGKIRNRFWVSPAGSVVKSKQWVSQGVGYAAVE